jgi:hypothetical protein
MTRTQPAVLHAQQPLSDICWATCVKMVLEVRRGKVNPDITADSISRRWKPTVAPTSWSTASSRGKR